MPRHSDTNPERRARRRPSPATAIAALALFAALGGTGYAAITLPANSVGAAQLKANAVTGPKVRNGSLLAQDFAAGQLRAGPQGAKGAPGATGAQGPKGETGATGPAGAGLSGFEVVTTTATVTPGNGDYYSAAAVTAPCPSGKTVIGGGYHLGTIAATVVVAHSRPNAARTGWETYVYNGRTTDVSATAYAICVKF